MLHNLKHPFAVFTKEIYVNMAYLVKEYQEKSVNMLTQKDVRNTQVMAHSKVDVKKENNVKISILTYAEMDWNISSAQTRTVDSST